MARAMRRSFSMLLLIALGVLVLGGVAPAGAGAAQSAPRVEVFEASRVPVAVWVGPRSARAAGAATFLLAGADVVAVSRDARVGPALPAELGRGRRPQAEERLVAETKLPAQVER